MVDKDSMIEEIRMVFREGATPARIVHYIMDRCAPSAVTDHDIKEYFRDAFALSPHYATMIYHLVDLVRSDDEERLAGTTWRLVAELVRTREEWDDVGGLRHKRSPSWYDEIETKVWLYDDASESLSCFMGKESWERLSQRDQNAIASIEISHLTCCENMLILARLVERLQQKLIERERKPVASERAGPSFMGGAADNTENGG
jgi:hypothetical protein